MFLRMGRSLFFRSLRRIRALDLGIIYDIGLTAEN